MGLRQRARVAAYSISDSVASWLEIGCDGARWYGDAVIGTQRAGSIPAVAISLELEALRRDDVGLALVLVARGGDEREVEGPIDGEALAPELQLAARAAEEDAVIDGDAHVAARRGRARAA